jgi:hypothetical protein
MRWRGEGEWHLVPARLDDEQHLGVTVELALPHVDRRDAGDLVDARRRPALHQRLGQRVGDLRAGRGDKADAHSFVGTCVCF